MKADKLSKDEQWSDSFWLILVGKSSSSTNCQHYSLLASNHDKDGMIKAALEALHEVNELEEVVVNWKEKVKTFQPEFHSYGVDVWLEM